MLIHALKLVPQEGSIRKAVEFLAVALNTLRRLPCPDHGAESGRGRSHLGPFKGNGRKLGGVNPGRRGPWPDMKMPATSSLGEEGSRFRSYLGSNGQGRRDGFILLRKLDRYL